MNKTSLDSRNFYDPQQELRLIYTRLNSYIDEMDKLTELISLVRKESMHYDIIIEKAVKLNLRMDFTLNQLSIIEKTNKVYCNDKQRNK